MSKNVNKRKMNKFNYTYYIGVINMKKIADFIIDVINITTITIKHLVRLIFILLPLLIAYIITENKIVETIMLGVLASAIIQALNDNKENKSKALEIRRLLDDTFIDYRDKMNYNVKNPKIFNERIRNTNNRIVIVNNYIEYRNMLQLLFKSKTDKTARIFINKLNEQTRIIWFNTLGVFYAYGIIEKISNDCSNNSENYIIDNIKEIIVTLYIMQIPINKLISIKTGLPIKDINEAIKYMKHAVEFMKDEKESDKFIVSNKLYDVEKGTNPDIINEVKKLLW